MKHIKDEWSRCSNCGCQGFRLTNNSKQEFVLRCMYCGKVTKISDLVEPVKPTKKIPSFFHSCDRCGIELCDTPNPTDYEYLCGKCFRKSS